ncbi:uncharacterized protein LOC143518474 isoform X2 [Brachyhypopomus gauderio]|uniref:uncharacterized protein LOC143518474 isoform X2 n=1 Tax=Brachyhypopomus gauderio TaxID=698409 RepID=UPI004042F050
MELQQMSSVIQNVYDEDESGRTGTKTEDVYQCLQYPPTTAQRTADGTEQPVSVQHGGRKTMVLLLLVLNSLLLTIILSLLATHYYQFRQSLGVMNTQDTIKGMWHLHDDMFYLVWTNHGDCSSAKRFCAERKARLATKADLDMAWLMSIANGKQLLLQRDQLEASGDGFSDDEDSDCDPEDSTMGVNGWVCVRAARVHTIGKQETAPPMEGAGRGKHIQST